MDEYSLQAPYDGDGIVVFSQGRCCSESFTLKDNKVSIQFCLNCQKKTFASKYPNSTLTQSRVFYGKRRECYSPHMIPGDDQWNRVMRSVVLGNGSIFSVFLGECCRASLNITNNVITFNFCMTCQSKNLFIKKNDRVQ